MSENLKPKSHAETTALFRLKVIGPVIVQNPTSRQLRQALMELSEQAFLPPGASVTRKYSFSTLERWYYKYRAEKLEGLHPRPRSDQGHAHALTEEQRKLLTDIGKEHPEAPVSVILNTLVTLGRIEKNEVSANTVRRFFVEKGLDRRTTKLKLDGNARKRWQAERPGMLWHGDVCHGPYLRVGERPVPLRIHALLDDASRYVVAIQAYSTEREVDMLALWVKALRRHGAPETLYLDNGSTYRGEALATACGRLGVNLLHAKPYDPQARGKMERFWRTLREGCLDHIGRESTLHDVQVRLLAFLDKHYHVRPHAGLMGQTPAQVYENAPPRPPPAEAAIKEALTVRVRRRVRRDGTVPVGGIDWEVEAGFLAGRKVEVARTLFEPKTAPWVEHEGQIHRLTRVDPIHNGRVRREVPKKRPGRGVDAIPFDPAGAMLDVALGRKNGGGPR